MTLPKRPLIFAGAGVLLLVGVFLLGRSSAPTRTQTIEKVVQVKQTVEVEKRVEVAAAQTADAHQVEWRTRTVYKPGGTVVVTKEVAQRDEKKTATETKVVAERVRTEVQERLVYREKVVEAAQPRWAFGASVGAGTDLRMRYQGDVGFRLVSGLWVTLAVAPLERAALVGARVTF